MIRAEAGKGRPAQMLRQLLWFPLFASPILAQGSTSPHTPVEIQKTITRYCFACHNDKLKTAGVSLAQVKADDIPGGAETWEKVLRKMRSGEMPPLGLPHPDVATNASVVEFLETGLNSRAKEHPNPGSPVIHRLNRAEYVNAIRDLLNFEIENTSTLPADDSGYGFDNIGEVLSVSPLHMEKYLKTARRVSASAVGTAKPKPALEKYTPSNEAVEQNGDSLPLSYRAGIEIHRHFPLDAEYSILVRVRGSAAPKDPSPKLDLRVDGKRAQLFDIKISAAEEQQDSRNYEIKIPLKAGEHSIATGILSEYAKAEGGVVPRPPLIQAPTPVSVDYVLIGGPFNPTGVSDTESRKRIFACTPTSVQSETPCARKIVTTLAHRAYRRPVTLADIAPLMKLFADGRRDGGSFDAGIETAVRAILISPSFLYRVEHSPRGAQPGSIHPVSELELASRLSFFLWSSIPDEELLRTAEQGKLRKTLPVQVRRMLADPKSASLVENFAGQWLHLRNIASWRPDPDKYPQFDESLRGSMQRETEIFFGHIVRDDRSVLEFLNADYSYLNDRLARHYGVDGIRGGFYRKVTMDGERGGILTQGSVLTVTSYPTRTSPVLRGKWILENVLGAPPPPPPPDVPNLGDSAEISAKDLRKALEQHRANAACASCHSRLDPLGFALEGYDAIGKFRAGEAIDTSGQLPGGAKFAGASGLKTVLMERKDDFVECLSEKLLTYALGRGLEYYDLPVVRDIRKETSSQDYRFSALTLAIVNSVPFQMRRVPDR